MNKKGFTLVELLTVLVVIAILLAIALPAMLTNRNQRKLVGVVGDFISDVQWARTQAAKDGNPVYLVFKGQFDAGQIEPPVGKAIGDPMTFSDPNDPTGTVYIHPPDNPGVGRVATGYAFVEARKRYHGPPRLAADPAEGTPYTYLDILNDVDAGLTPLEPVYPKAPGEPGSGFSINRLSKPEFFYPTDLEGGGSYGAASYLGLQFMQGVTSTYQLPGRQATKIFCTTDYQELLAMNASGAKINNRRVYVAGVDHPMLNDQVVDYFVIKEKTVPTGVYIMNPWKDEFVIENSGGPNNYQYFDFQYLQFIFGFEPDGSINLYQWTYDPELFPATSSGDNGQLVHGRLEPRTSIPETRTLFFVTEDAVEFSGTAARIAESRAAQLSGNGRSVSFWPLNGKYTVDEYTPNDRRYYLDDSDQRLNINADVTSNHSWWMSSAFKRNFLTQAK